MNAQAHLKVVALVHLALGLPGSILMAVLLSQGVLTALVPRSIPDMGLVTSLLLLLASLVVAWALLAVLGGAALLMGLPVGRKLVRLAAFLELFYVPVGTLVGGYTLWVLTRFPQPPRWQQLAAARRGEPVSLVRSA